LPSPFKRRIRWLYISVGPLTKCSAPFNQVRRVVKRGKAIVATNAGIPAWRGAVRFGA
jgi:hypothetical protein